MKFFCPKIQQNAVFQSQTGTNSAILNPKENITETTEDVPSSEAIETSIPNSSILIPGFTIPQQNPIKTIRINSEFIMIRSYLKTLHLKIILRADLLIQFNFQRLQQHHFRNSIEFKGIYQCTIQTIKTIQL